MNRVLFLFFLIIVSCAKETVELPVISNKGITDVYNESYIWFFYKVSDGDTLAEVNIGNKITNTNLIFHIDKKLQMKHIIPKLIPIQEKLKEDSMHKKEGMKNYFSFADTSHQTYALVDFTNTQYIREETATQRDSIHGTTLDVFDESFALGSKIYPFSGLETRLNKFGADSAKTKVLSIKFCETLTYDKYLHMRAVVQNLAIAHSDIEIIYTKK